MQKYTIQVFIPTRDKWSKIAFKDDDLVIAKSIVRKIIAKSIVRKIIAKSIVQKIANFNKQGITKARVIETSTNITLYELECLSR